MMWYWFGWNPSQKKFIHKWKIPFIVVLMIFSKWFWFSTIGELFLCGAFCAFYMYHGSSFMAFMVGSFYQEKFIEFGRGTWSHPIGARKIRGILIAVHLCPCPLPLPPIEEAKFTLSKYIEDRKYGRLELLRTWGCVMRLFDILTILLTLA